MMNAMLETVQKMSMKEDVDAFEVGDTVDVHVNISETDAVKAQIFTGTVIAKQGSGVGETFTVRRIVAGEGVERTFPLHSPKVLKIESKRKGKIRRAKVYFLRDRVGKATKLKERK